MTSYLVVSIASGILLVVMDALINANPIARKLLAAYKPIAKTSVNIAAGTVIDLAYGFILAGLFLQLYPVLPGDTGLARGMSYALIIWFLRVVMNAASQWMTLNVPLRVLLYLILSGLAEMLMIGVLYGLALPA